MRVFLDTNVLVYAFGVDARSEEARRLIGGGGVIALQSLNEFTDIVRRKMGMNWSEVRLAIEHLLSACTLHDRIGASVHGRAIDLAEKYHLRIFDAALLAIALEAECDTFINEDLHAGLVVDDRLTVRNPFA